MGKCLTSLLILAASLLWPNEIYADEQVRRVQEELRKRHLFYADANGEKGAALTLAIKRYQEKKGFSPTGAIDSVTLASLGIRTAPPVAAATPVVVGKRGQVHGANGEGLPHYPSFPGPTHESGSKFDPAIIGQDYIDLELADGGRQGVRRPILGKRVRPMSPGHELGAPFEAAFEPASKQIQHATANPVWSTLVLQPAAGESGELDAFDDERIQQATVRPDRRSHRRTRRVRPRKETNPFILTYQSVDRAIRSLFSDTQTKKKRSTVKRL